MKRYLTIPPERGLRPNEHRRLRAALINAINDETSSSRVPHRSRRRRVGIAVALLGAVTLLVPTVGLGRMLQALGLRTPHVQELQDSWRDDLAEGVKDDPDATFSNPSPAALKSRLDAAAAAGGFRVVSLTLLHPKGDAPLVVLQSAHPSAFAKMVPALVRQIDPKTSGDDLMGWAYEGLFIEARDGNGDPFLVVFNHWRGPHAGGGQWARSDDLYPYPHG